jgi:superfamily I DNA and/or RNA helicase/very-short-patch-repair endonuclease
MDNLKNLIKYYTECIEIESLSEFSFPSFKENEKFFIPKIETEWSSKEDTLQQNLTQSIRRNLALERQSTALYYGWPTYVKSAISKRGTKYYWFKPLFYLKIEIVYNENELQLNLLREWPQINNDLLQFYVRTFEERIQVIDTLGLSEADSIPEEGLISYWKKLLELYPDINELNPEFHHDTDFNENGYYNFAIIFLAGTPRYSRQLLKELRLLQQPDYLNNAKNTCISSLLKTDQTENKLELKPSLVTPLNRSQRQSLSRAFSNSLSAITGPPGTGKSQVVLNMIVNAFENNQSVLFTSKNNKAVDVVCERILKTIDFPINLRLGAKFGDRDYTTEFLDLLDKVLSGSDRSAVLSKYRRSKENHESLRETYYNALAEFDKIVSTRNQINELDQELEKYESIIDEDLINKIKNLSYNESPCVSLAENELKMFSEDNIPFTYKFFGFFYKKFSYKKLHQYLIDCSSLINNILPYDEEIKTDLSYYNSFYLKFLNVYNYLKIYSTINTLRKTKHLTHFYKVSSDLAKFESEFIDATKKYIEALGRYRIVNLDNEQRRDLTNYYSVVRSLSGEYPGDRAYARLKKEQEKLFPKISKLLPIWSITNLSVGGHVPFIPNTFDLLIIDESSQSDIASAIPLLYRSSNAVIIGDPQQLKHISSIRKSQDTRLMEKYNLLEDDNFRFSYSIQSLYHCARGIVSSDSVTLLNEHYRSHFSIIEFSNREWYDSHLDIRTNYANLFFPPDSDGFNNRHLNWFDLKGHTTRPGGRSALNKNEADRTLDLLNTLINYYNDKKPSIGIVTPFTAQAEYFKDQIIKNYEERFINDYFLITDTAHKFQGDERDIVIFSPVISDTNENDSTLTGFLRSTSNLFNVSITRARSMLYVVGDKSKCISSGISYLKSFIEYIEQKKYEDIDLPYSGFASPWEKKLYEALVAEGFSPQIQHQAGPYFIDIALFRNDKKIAIEVDGEQWHTDLTGDRLERDIMRDRNLAKMGFEILRFWTHDLKYNLSGSIDKIYEKVNNSK